MGSRDTALSASQIKSRHRERFSEYPLSGLTSVGEQGERLLNVWCASTEGKRELLAYVRVAVECMMVVCMYVCMYLYTQTCSQDTRRD